MKTFCFNENILYSESSGKVTITCSMMAGRVDAHRPALIIAVLA